MPSAAVRTVPTLREDSAAALATWKRVRGCDGGTDCGDVIRTSAIADGRIAIVVADVAGRGPRCAQLGTRVAERILALLAMGFSPRFATEIVDAGIRHEPEHDATHFVAAFVAVVDTVQERLTYASAGHETALLLASEGTYHHLATNGPAVGILSEPEFGEHTVAFRTGESLVVVTDGVTDSRPGAGSAFFGSAGVVESVARSLRARANAAYFVVSDALRHARGWHADDTSAFVATLQRG